MNRPFISVCAGMIMAAVCSVTAFADTTDKLVVQDKVSEGETFTVTVEVDSDTNIGYMQSSLEYDDSIIQFVDGEAIGGGGLITVQTYPTSSPDKINCVLTFKAVGSGQADIRLTNGYVFSADGVVLCESSASASVQVEGGAQETQPVTSAPDETTVETSAPTESSSKPDDGESSKTEPESKAETATTVQTTAAEVINQGYLTELSCSAGKLVPDFSYDVYEYTVYAENSTETAEFKTTAAAFSDTVEISDGGALQVGDNIRTITVTTEDERQRVYTINIIREDADDSSAESSNSRAETESKPVSRDKYKEFLNPALAIVLVTLLVAFAIVLMWIRSLNSKKKKKRR